MQGESQKNKQPEIRVSILETFGRVNVSWGDIIYSKVAEKHAKHRRSHPKMFFKKCIVKNICKIHRNTPATG